LLWHMLGLPSGKHTKNYGKSPFFHGKFHYKWWFSIVMLVYQRVSHLLGWFLHIFMSVLFWLFKYKVFFFKSFMIMTIYVVMMILEHHEWLE
jgi:hypothetical protein